MSHTTLDFPAIIRAGGHRLTPQRHIILDTLCEMGGHVTVAELYERVSRNHPAIDRSTVYRALDFFRELGLVCVAEVGGVARFEIAPDGRGGAHRHLVCRDCGHIDHAPDGAFADLAARLLSQYGFAADVDQLTIQGVCKECKETTD